jgi:hypothetical protein
MSLPARQQRVLDMIEGVLQASEPKLAAMFAMFARLTGGEGPASGAVPVGGDGPAGSQPPSPGAPLLRRRRRLRSRPPRWRRLRLAPFRLAPFRLVPLRLLPSRADAPRLAPSRLRGLVLIPLLAACVVSGIVFGATASGAAACGRVAVAGRLPAFARLACVRDAKGRGSQTCDDSTSWTPLCYK